MPPADEPGRRYRSPRHGEPDPRWGGPGAVAPVEDDPYGDVPAGRRSGGRHGAPDDGGPRHGDGRRIGGRDDGGWEGGWDDGDGWRADTWSSRPRLGGGEHPDDALGGGRPGPAPWPPPSALPSGRFGPDDAGWDRPSWRFGSEEHGPGPAGPTGPPYGAPDARGAGRPGQQPPPYGPPPAFGPPPNGSSSPYGPPRNGTGSNGSSPYGQAPPSPPYGQAPPSPPYGQAPPSPPYGQAPPSPPSGHGQPPSSPPGPGGGPGSTAVQPPVDTPATADEAEAPLLAGGTPPPRKRDEADGVAPSSRSPRAGSSHDDDGEDEAGTTVHGGAPSRHRRGAGSGPGPGRNGDEGSGDASGPGRRSRARGTDEAGGKKKRKGSFWRELPLLVVVAIVLTFVIQTFVARIYVIPSASMEQTLHGCDGCANDRVAVDKVTYRFSDPAPGDVVVFKGPPAWLDNDEVGETQPSSNPLIRGFQDALSLVGLAAPNEKDFVKRVIATGGQTVACCDATNHVLVDGKPINEPYLYYQPGLGDKQATFDPVRVPDGQLWVMGDNRNNSADARFHGPVPVSDVIGKVRVVVLPISRWRTVPAIDPQTTTAALAGTGLPLGTGTAGAAAGALLAVPVIGAGRRLRRAAAAERATGAPPRPGSPGPDREDGGEDRRAAEADRE